MVVKTTAHIAELTHSRFPDMLVRVIGRQELRRSFYEYEARVTWLTAIALALFFFATNIYIAQRRLLWFDELTTLRTARMSGLATLWHVQNSWAGDSAPILYALLNRFSYVLSGGAEISIRIVSALAMLAAMLVTFDCARRLRDGWCGLIAICVLSGSFLPYYGFEGRPYMLLVLFTATAVWLWLNTGRKNAAAALAFGVTTFCVIGVHFYGILMLVPFFLWDFWQKRSLRVSSKLLAAIIGTVFAVTLCAQQILSGTQWTGSSWCPPSGHALVSVYTQIFPYGAFMLAAFILLVCVTRPVALPMGEAERFCWLFLTIPIAGFIVAKIVTNHFLARYFVSMLPGVSVACACLMSRRLTKRASIVLISLLAAIPVGQQMLLATTAESLDVPSATGQQNFTRNALALENAIVADGKTNIIANFILAEEARHYSKRPELYVSLQSDDQFHYYCKDASSCWTADKVKHRGQHLVAMNPSKGLLTVMRRAGFVTTVKATDPLVVYFSSR